jgi:hydroxymethylpyrimidine pyrophosphatase-like HAD family hydrolase
MRYLALACDYDGTLASHGTVDGPTLEALERLRASGRKLIMVTGRELDDLMNVFPHTRLFDRIVAENGAVLYDPATREIQSLAAPPPSTFVQELQRRSITPLSVGRVIVATWEPNQSAVFEVIHDLGLELHVIFNKGAVMVLPPGVNKATGLRRALDALKLSPHNTVGVGDAENDHAFLEACECGVAVANALDSVKAHVDLVTAAERGDGVSELIDRLIATDLEDLRSRLTRHDLVIGHTLDGDAVRVSVNAGTLLIAGPSGGGKTTVTTTLLERLCEAGYQFCVFDPEGDYYEFPGAIALRGGDTRALVEDTLRVLDRPAENAVVNLMDQRLDERPEMLHTLLPRLLQLRGATGRPHWIVIDEAHHVLPSTWQASEPLLPAQLENVVLVTIHPDHVSSGILGHVDTLIVVGREAQATLDAFARGRGDAPIGLGEHEDDAALAWFVRIGAPPIRFQVSEPTSERRRHQRKYAAGELGEDKSFYFRGPAGRLNLRAQNLELFSQIADGVDDETWQYHLRRHDVSRWFQRAIKDEALAAEASEIEAQADMAPRESRAQIRAAIQRRYTTSS